MQLHLQVEVSYQFKNSHKMANAKIDENGVKTILGTLQSDGVTPILLKMNTLDGSAKAVDGTTGTASTRVNTVRDENNHPAWIGVSSVDGKTPVPVAFDSNGNILIQTT